MKRRFTEHPTNIIASTRPHPKIPVGWERIPEGDDDDGNWGTIAKALPNNQGYYWINIIEDEQGRRCFELEVGYRGSDGSIGKIWKVSSKPFYRLSDIVTYADTKWKQLQNEYDEDIDACDKVTASSRYEPDDSGIESYQAQCRSKKDNVLCIKRSNNQIDRYRFHSIDGLGDVFEPETGSGNWWTSYIVTPDNTLLSWQFSGRYTPVDATYGEDFWVETASEENIESATDAKYFANMVSASNDPELDDSFLIEGYYDNQRRGLAESAETSDVSALNELANEYANKGYYIVVHNLTDGVITEFSADNWFNDIAPDGGACLFMSW